MTLRRVLERVALITAACAVAAWGAGGVSLAANAPSGQTNHALNSATAGSAGVNVKHYMLKRGVKAASVSPAATSNLTYHNGPVEHAPKVYLVFWGTQWGSNKTVEPYMNSYFSGVGVTPSGGKGDDWSPIMTQYSDTTGAPHFGTSVLGGVWWDQSSAAPSNATTSQISSEANNGASHFGVSGPGVDVFVLSPSGTHPDGFNTSSGSFCAWHSWNGNVAYTNMPFVLDLGTSCGENAVRSQLDGFSITGGHEYAEAVTDPEVNAWYDSSGEEIGDKCAWTGLATQALTTGDFAIQPLWSNSKGGCTTTP